SQSFKKVDNKTILTNTNLFSLNDNNEMEFNYSDNNLFNPDEEILPQLKNNIDTLYKPNSLTKLYNNLVQTLGNYEDSKDLISSEFVNPEDIVILYKNDFPLTMHYREFLSNGQNIAANLINNNINLVNSKIDLNELIINTTNIEPAKVVVVYDLLNNIIN
ncbi:MAG: hypothetical protein K2K73_02475, partial [Ureaplasma sp.]|nr:hypothetical protein [Ureaplasma sp.]